MSVNHRLQDKLAQGTTEEIQKYINKYCYPTAPGKFSSSRRKKILFLKKILLQREKAMSLLTSKM